MNDYSPSSYLKSLERKVEKKQTSLDIQESTRKAYSETAALIELLEKKRQKLDEEIQNLKRKQSNRFKFLNQK